VFRTDNFGGDWEKINDGLTLKNDNIDNDANRVLNDDQETAAGAGRIRLAIQQNAAAQNNTVYAALISDSPTDHLMGVFSSTATLNPVDQTWTLVGQVGVVASAPPKAELTREVNTPTRITFAAGGNPRDIQHNLRCRRRGEPRHVSDRSGRQ
jgi:hypothetical protein